MKDKAIANLQVQRFEAMNRVEHAQRAMARFQQDVDRFIDDALWLTAAIEGLGGIASDEACKEAYEARQPKGLDLREMSQESAPEASVAPSALGFLRR